MALHVYAVVPAGVPLPALRGVGDPPGPLRLVTGQGIAAVVSEIDDPAALTEDDAVRHFDILAEMAAAATVLPVRFGTAAPDDAAVRDEVLGEAAGAPLRAGLAALEGMVELRIDLAFDEQRVLRDVVTAEPQLRDLGGRGGDMDLRVRTGEAVANRVQAWTRDRGERLMAPVVPLARHAVRLAGQDALVDRWALLVARERVSEVDDAVSALRQRDEGVSVEYVGPLAPADFLDEPAGETGSGSRWGW